MNPVVSEIIEKAGGQQAYADHLSLLTGQDISQPRVHYWLHKSKKGIPGEFCQATEKISGIPCRRIRPDLFDIEKIQKDLRRALRLERDGVRA